MSLVVAECTPAPAPPPAPPGLPPLEGAPPRVPPMVDPALWEDFPVFRETFLMYLTLPPYADALRTVGDFLFMLVLDVYGGWPAWSESATRTELRAALADLRHLEGFLASVGKEHVLSSLSPDDARLSQLAGTLAAHLGELAGTLGAALGPAPDMPSESAP